MLGNITSTAVRPVLTELAGASAKVVRQGLGNGQLQSPVMRALSSSARSRFPTLAQGGSPYKQHQLTQTASTATFKMPGAQVQQQSRSLWNKPAALPAPENDKQTKTETGKPRSGTDYLLSAYDGRGLSKFFQPGAAEKAAEVLAKAENVMLVTGFSVDRHMPETDGPPGTAALGHALKQLGKTVTYVTDPANAPVLKAALRPLEPNADFVRIEVFNEQHGAKASGTAAEILDRYKPDALVTVELPSRSADGHRRNMRGVEIDEFNPPMDQLLIEANARPGVKTISIGDGGNEAGMGNMQDQIPTALNGKPMAAATTSDVPVTGFASNFAAETVAAVLLKSAGRLDLLHTSAQQTAMIHASLGAGAVDGVTRERVAGQVDAKGYVTGVDGFSTTVHNGMLEMLRTYLSQTEAPFDADLPEKPEGRFLVGTLDSGNGGLVATSNLDRFISTRSPHDVSFAMIVDHGAGMYGNKSSEALTLLVQNELVAAEKLGVDVIVMACNTACTVLDAAAVDIKTPIVNLVDVTANAVLSKGGAHPLILATDRTVGSNAYQDRVESLSGGKITPFAIATQPWVKLVEDGKQLSEDPADRAEVAASVRKYVARVPTETTSVWLCCTHFPELKGQIEDALKERGLGHVKVLDPMEYQADATIAKMHELKTPRSSEVGDKSIVVTTGDATKVSASAAQLLGKPTEVVHSKFGKELDVSLIAAKLFTTPPKAMQDSAAGDRSRAAQDAGTDKTVKSKE